MTAPVQQLELNDARRGALYFLGNLEVSRNPSFDLGLVSNFVGGTSILSDLKFGACTVLDSTKAGHRLLEGFETIKDKIKAALASFFDALSDRMAAIYGEGSAVMEWVGEFVSWAVSTFAGSLGDIIPGWGYVQDAGDLYDGIKQSVSSSIKWLGQIYSGWGVKLLDGSPAIMAEAIARHNATGLAGGLKDIAITSTKIGLKAAGDATAGVGSIVGAVTGILQRIANLVGYCAQRYLLSQTISQASFQFNKDGDMIQQQEAFIPWFKKACVFTPIVAALCLNCGYTAHPYRFLQLISSTDELIDQAAFDKGVAHIDNLKDLSGKYLREYTDGYKLKIVCKDPVSNTILQKVFSS